jgi:hypothetical protein
LQQDFGFLKNEANLTEIGRHMGGIDRRFGEVLAAEAKCWGRFGAGPWA